MVAVGASDVLANHTLRLHIVGFGPVIALAADVQMGLAVRAGTRNAVAGEVGSRAVVDLSAE